MKTVVNKHISFPVKDWNDTFTALVDKTKETSYFQLIEDCVNKPSAASQQAQFSYNDIVSIHRVKKALEGKSDIVEFEDSDFEFIQKQVAATTWSMSRYEFVEFMDYIKGIK